MSEPIELYRPGSATEAMRFMAKWCERCRKDADPDDPCEIPGVAQLFEEDEDDYPREWRYRDGKPVCTAFERIEGP